MKNAIKKAISILLVAIMVFGVVPLAGFVGLELFEASAATITSYEQGDIIEFGCYPQSKVTDEIIISTLNTADGEWISYNYYSGTEDADDGNITASDYMRYKDVMYGSDKYRGVVFDSYRPDDTRSSQDDNGYNTGTVYWFKYEPIKWRVLDPATGMVMAETILDSQTYNNYVLRDGSDEYGYLACWGDSSKTYYANNYEKSSIRKWLNNDFYNTAFSASQQSKIQYTTLDNSAYSDSYSAYDSASTNDKIYLLSYDEVLDYAFSNCSDLIIAQGSDYAKCQGLYVTSNYSKSSHWQLRTPGYVSANVCCVDYQGYVNTCGYSVNDTLIGTRPALNFNVTSDLDKEALKTPSQQTVSYGDSITLRVDLSKIPDGGYVEWYPSNSNFTYTVSSDGTTCTISPNKSGDTTFTAIVYDAEGNIVSVDKQTMTSKAGFFDKIIAFFKKLFGATKVIPQAFKVIY